ncbi:MAG: efflux RND transporter periplasmic adaptor subunit [Planctomyces sp.]|nr:efflux RND transporter periplasmic adaptor subunit [Planctomyces sp.]
MSIATPPPTPASQPPSEGSREALSKLRIRREPTPKSSPFGKLLKYSVVLAGLLLVGYVGMLVAVREGWVNVSEVTGGSLLTVPDSLQKKSEVQTGLVSIERGRSADAVVVGTGYIESRQQARIGARATGRIEAVHVEEGSKVSANDILAVLEHADLDAALAAANATLARTKSELLEQDVTIARLRREFDRSERLINLKTITDAEFDTAKFELDGAQARMESLKAAVQLAEARVRESEQLRENMFVRAPFAGTVISKDAELGESIMPGGMGEASGRGSVVTIADLEHLEVDCDVKEGLISRITSDQPAEIVVDAVPDRRYQGKVRKVIPMGDRARATVKVKVEFTDADEKLFPEMSCTVYFLSSQTNDSKSADNASPRMFCPAAAIIEKDGMAKVWEVKEDGKIQLRTITPGDTRDGRTEILDGLSGGEKLILSPSPELREGQLVTEPQ